MFSLCCSSHGGIPKAFLLHSSSLCIRLLRYSTASDKQPHVMVDYLIDSLGFSKPEAIAASTKVRHLNSTKKPQSVIDFLRSYDFSETEIRSVVVSQPNILLRKVDKTLEPKFKILREIGFSGSDLAAVLKTNSSLLNSGLHTTIIPAISFLRKILGSDEKIVKHMKSQLWSFNVKSFRSNVLLLERYGVSHRDIGRLIIGKPRSVGQSPLRLEEKLVRVETELGILRGSTKFSDGLYIICSLSKLTIQKKLVVFKSFGWCDYDINTIVKSRPFCLAQSVEGLSKSLNFFMKELGCTPTWLCSRGTLLALSLEKRVKPRYQVFKVLKEQGVISMGLKSILCLSNTDFLKQVMLRHKEGIPSHLYDSVTKDLKC